jgi:hypothetical protein
LKSKIEESGPVPVDTLYKNFMGVGGPKGKNYGLSRRLIDLFLLCLVREGKVQGHPQPFRGVCRECASNGFTYVLPCRSTPSSGTT